jgi:serine/threonine protein kinase
MESAERDEIIMALLASTLPLPAGEREPYLRSICQDPEVRTEVLDRAEWEDRMGNFLRTPLLCLPADAPVAGRKIGHYRVQSELGHGGMGVVFKAIDENLGRTVAVKVLSNKITSAHDRQRFLREAKAASALNHPNIVTIHEFNSDHGLDFLAMEYIEGKTLDQAVSRNLPLGVSLGYARQIAGALAKAHAAGIVHRDLKPGNVMVTKDGQVKVLDFGLAKHQHPSASPTPEQVTETTESFTIAGSMLGTPAYMSPEQVLGERLDQRSDIFSFGIILYQMVCGVRPFIGPNRQATLVQIVGQPHRPVRELNPAAPPALATLIDSCLEKKPENRLSSMDQAATELCAIVAGLDKPQPQPSRTRSFLPWMLAAGLALAAGCGAWIVQQRRTHPTAAAPMSAHTLRYDLLSSEGTTPVPIGTTFQSGSKVYVRLSSSEAGFVYVINQGQGPSGSRLWVLLPDRQASAAIAAHQDKRTGGLVFDKTPGTERFWVLWARQPIQVLEDAAHSESKGLIGDAGQAEMLQKLLDELNLQTKTSFNKAGTEAQVQAAGDRMASQFELRHR